MKEKQENLLPDIPDLTEYQLVKNEIESKIIKINSITQLTEENKKIAKNGIAELNKVKDRISRYRIDETNKFLAYIQPYVDKCKELEKLCVDGVADIKIKIKQLEDEEKKQKKISISRLFDFAVEQDYTDIKPFLKFEMFFEDKMANKSTSLTVVEKELNDWLSKKASDINFIKNNVDEPSAVLEIYLKNGQNLTSAIEEYQSRFVTENEIKAMIADEKSSTNTFEKRLNVVVRIKQLPKSKATALQSFLNSLNVDFEVEIE